MKNDIKNDLNDQHLRLQCAEIAVKYGTKLGFSRDACLREAEKLYTFAMGATAEEAAPIEGK